MYPWVLLRNLSCILLTGILFNLLKYIFIFSKIQLPSKGYNLVSVLPTFSPIWSFTGKGTLSFLNLTNITWPIVHVVSCLDSNIEWDMTLCEGNQSWEWIRDSKLMINIMRGQSYPSNTNLKRMSYLMVSQLAKSFICNNFVQVPMIDNAQADDQANLGVDLRLGRTST